MTDYSEDADFACLKARADIQYRVYTGELTPRQAVREFREQGYSYLLALEAVHEALGGGDVVHTNDQGVRVYAGSERPVEEVRKLMKGT